MTPYAIYRCIAFSERERERERERKIEREIERDPHSHDSASRASPKGEHRVERQDPLPEMTSGRGQSTILHFRKIVFG